jgi:hypothetical protein
MDTDTLAAWTPNYGGRADFAFDDRHRYVALAGDWSGGTTWIGARKRVPGAAFVPTPSRSPGLAVPSARRCVALSDGRCGGRRGGDGGRMPAVRGVSGDGGDLLYCGGGRFDCR